MPVGSLENVNTHIFLEVFVVVVVFPLQHDRRCSVRFGSLPKMSDYDFLQIKKSICFPQAQSGEDVTMLL